MKFTVATKPLADSLNLAIISSNITQYYQKSCVTQISVRKDMLFVNVEVDGLVTEVRLKGKAEGADDGCSVMVDSLLLKQLVGTFEDTVTLIEFVQGGVVFHSGKSQFTLPQILDSSELSLNAPKVPGEGEQAVEVPINKDDWKFVKDQQMYALAMTASIHPVYTYVWISDKGDVMVSDVDNGLITHSSKGNLQITCLLKDTIVNLFNSLPDGAKLIRFSGNYLIIVQTDGYALLSQFTPSFEDSGDLGSYNSEMLFQLLVFPDDDCVTVSNAAINKVLSQADLFTRDSEKTIQFVLEAGKVRLHDDYVDCSIPVKGAAEPFEVSFKTKLLKAALAHFTQDEIKIAATKQEGNTVGIILQSADLTTVVAGVDE